MADITFAIPALWLPSGGAQRYTGTAVKTITFGANEQGCYIQALTQNVRVTIGTTLPVIGGNDVGFQIKAGDPAVLVTGQPGMQLNILQEVATADVQYQMLTLAGRFS